MVTALRPPRASLSTLPTDDPSEERRAHSEEIPWYIQELPGLRSRILGERKAELGGERHSAVGHTGRTPRNKGRATGTAPAGMCAGASRSVKGKVQEEGWKMAPQC